MTYQRNILGPCLEVDEPVDDVLPHEIGDVEVHADHDTGDQHDDRRLDHLALTRPFDLLELGPRFGDEAAALAALSPGLALGRLRARANLGLPGARALRHALALRLAAGPPLRSCRPGH